MLKTGTDVFDTEMKMNRSVFYQAEQVSCKFTPNQGENVYDRIEGFIFWNLLAGNFFVF